MSTKATASMALLGLLHSACSFDVDVDVGTGPHESMGQESSGSEDSGSDGPGETSTSGGTTGEWASSGAHDGGGTGSSGAADSSTGEPQSECPGVATMIDDRCTCTLDSGKTRLVNPSECGCLWSGACFCDDGQHPDESCGWPCTDALDGQGCQCGEYDAPTEWCIYTCTETPVMVDGSCMCADYPIDPMWCGCDLIAPEVCSCFGLMVPEWFCG